MRFFPILVLKSTFILLSVEKNRSFRSNLKIRQKCYYYLTAVNKVEDGDEIVELDPVQENDRFGERVLVQQVEEECTARR